VLGSIQKHFELIPHLYVFTDFGFPDSKLLDIKAIYPAEKLTIISAEECLQYYQKKGNALIKEFASKNPMGLKMAAVMQVLDLGLPVLYTDTDVLWLKNPINDINSLIENELNINMSFDYQAGYDLNLIEKAKLDIVLNQPYYCAGIMLINYLTEDQKTAINEILPVAILESGHLTEQTIFAYLQKLTGLSKMSEEKYLLFYSDQFDIRPSFPPSGLARHYIGPVRHLFWRDAFFNN
jgi:hypothetical protein